MLESTNLQMVQPREQKMILYCGIQVCTQSWPWRVLCVSFACCHLHGPVQDMDRHVCELSPRTMLLHCIMMLKMLHWTNRKFLLLYLEELPAVVFY